MKVKVHKFQLDHFRRKARNSATEILAYLVGRVGSKQVAVDTFIYPELSASSPGHLTVTREEIQLISDVAKAHGLQVVGDIHSHPNAAPVMSRTDYMDHIYREHAVSGIVEVTNRHTRVCFWQDGSPLPCTLEYL